MLAVKRLLSVHRFSESTSSLDDLKRGMIGAV